MTGPAVEITKFEPVYTPFKCALCGAGTNDATGEEICPQCKINNLTADLVIANDELKALKWRPIETARDWLTQNPDRHEILVLCDVEESDEGRMEIAVWSRSHWTDRSGEKVFPRCWMPQPGTAA